MCDRIRSRASCCLALPLLLFASVVGRQRGPSATAGTCWFVNSLLTTIQFNSMPRFSKLLLSVRGRFVQTWDARGVFPTVSDIVTFCPAAVRPSQDLYRGPRHRTIEINTLTSFKNISCSTGRFDESLVRTSVIAV